MENMVLIQKILLLKPFQKTQGLYVDGDAGPKTISALMQRDSKITTKELLPVDGPVRGPEKG